MGKLIKIKFAMKYMTGHLDKHCMGRCSICVMGLIDKNLCYLCSAYLSN